MSDAPIKLIFSACICALTLGGCTAASDKYPSLAIHDFERAGQDGEPPAQAQPLDAARKDTIRNARAIAMRENAAFLAALPNVQRKIAATRGLNASSNSWADGQIALADLIAHRGQTAIALSDIDAALAAASAELADIASERAIQSEVEGILAGQDQSLARLGATR